ncbi:multivesicular body subunit 12 [archaeon]|nr:MAG: multivesicular body subunit 12 [archaeon]
MATDLSKFPSLSSNTHNGNELALKLLADLTNPLWDAGCVWQESLCRGVLEECEDKNLLIKIDSTRKLPKKADKKANSTDIFAKLNSFTPNQQKNHALRFGVEQAAAAGTHRGSTWGFKSFVTGSPAETRDYEDVLSQEILDAPICDVCIIQYGEAVPDGFYRLLKTPSNKKANLNSGSGGNPIYLCLKKDLSGKAAPIVNFIVIFPDRSEYVPPGYHVVQRGKTACNINTGTGSERVYLCYKKDFLGNPLIDIQVGCIYIHMVYPHIPSQMHYTLCKQVQNSIYFHCLLCKPCIIHTHAHPA